MAESCGKCNKKTLILINSKDMYFWSFIPDAPQYEVAEVYQSSIITVPYWLRKKIRGLTYHKFGKLGDWSKHLAEYEKIIVLDSAYSRQIIKILKRCVMKKGCYIFFWNKMHLVRKMALAQLKAIDPVFKIYSYNRTDCQRYNVMFNTSFYYPLEMINEGNIKGEDIVFLGDYKRRRDRIKKLDSVCELLKKYKISSWIYMTGPEEYSALNFKIMRERIPYKEYLKKVFSCKAILDIDTFGEEGYSLRAMEALFYEKKYITDNMNIKNEDFYSSKNVFILGVDNENKLKDFMDGEFEPVDPSIKDKYLIDNWIKRFV